MRLSVLLLLICPAGGGAAFAQGCASPPPSGPPILHLSKTATIKAEPTVLVADLVADETSRSAIAAQRHVKELMAKAKAIAGKMPGVIAVFEDYETDFSAVANELPAHWETSQTLELSVPSGDIVLALTGQLQALGLSISNLGWQVPQDQADAADRKARLAALATVRAEATQFAQTLGLSLGYQSIDLTGGTSPIFSSGQGAPVPQMAAMALPSPPKVRRTSVELCQRTSSWHQQSLPAQRPNHDSTA